MIEVKNVTKRYGAVKALDDISFTADSGEVLGLLGPNGAGKSTTMNIMTGYLSANEGAMLIDGIDILEHPKEAKAKIGYLPEIPPLYPDMTVRRYLEFIFELKKVRLPKKEHIDEAMQVVKISDVGNRVIRNLSKGYRQRVGLAQSLIGNPSVLILDEPTVGLDPRQIVEIRDVIRELGKKRTIILSTHILPEVEQVCERVLVIKDGRIIADDTPAGLQKGVATGTSLALRCAGARNPVGSVVRGVSGVKKVSYLPDREEGACDLLVETDGLVDVRKPLFNALAQAGFPILQLRPQDLTLEEIFMSLTEESGR